MNLTSITIHGAEEVIIMIDAKEREVLAKGLQVIWVMWTAMFASLGIYIIVANMFFEKVNIKGLSPDVFSFLRSVLYVVSVIEFAVIRFIRKIMLTADSRIALASAQPIPGTGKHPATARYASAMMVSLAIAESIAIYGLMLYFLGKDSQSLYLLTAIGAVAMFIYRPKMAELEKLAIALHKNY